MKSQRKACPFEKWDDKRAAAFDCFTEIEAKEKKMHLQFEKSEKNREITDYIENKQGRVDSFCHLCPQGFFFSVVGNQEEERKSVYFSRQKNVKGVC